MMARGTVAGRGGGYVCSRACRLFGDQVLTFRWSSGDVLIRIGSGRS